MRRSSGMGSARSCPSLWHCAQRSICAALISFAGLSIAPAVIELTCASPGPWQCSPPHAGFVAVTGTRGAVTRQALVLKLGPQNSADGCLIRGGFPGGVAWGEQQFPVRTEEITCLDQGLTCKFHIADRGEACEQAVAVTAAPQSRFNRGIERRSAGQLDTPGGLAGRPKERVRHRCGGAL